MLSLFEFFTKKRRFSQILRRVSPPLVGAVLLCVSVVDVFAAVPDRVDVSFFSTTSPTSNYVIVPTSRSVVWNGSSSRIIYANYDVVENWSVRVVSAVPGYPRVSRLLLDCDLSGAVNFVDINTFGNYGLSSLDVESVTFIDRFGNSYPLTFSASRNTTVTPGVKDYSIHVYGYSDIINNISSSVLVGVISVSYRFTFFAHSSLVSTASYDNMTLKHSSSLSGTGYLFSAGTGQYLDPSTSAIVDSVDSLKDQQQSQFNQEINSANKQGSDAQGLVTNLNNLSGKWSILWYPITFTNDVFQAFTGGGAAYSMARSGLSGYRYDDDIGELVPVFDYASRAAPGGTVITFPSFSILGYQIWDSYDFDLSTVKQQIPAVFDGIYVIVSILETIWFVSFLRSKYEEVFG